MKTSVLMLFSFVGLSLLIPQVWGIDSEKEFVMKDYDATLIIIEKQVKYVTPYKITSAIINDVNLSCDSGSLALSILSNDAGTLQLEIPQSMLGGIFMVLVDESEWDDVSIIGNTITVNFPENISRIEIFGTFYLSPDKYTGICDAIHDPPHSYILSPLQQFKSGIPIDEIKCKDDFVVAIKNSNGNPACVKPETKTKLMELGWAEPLDDIVKQRTFQSDDSVYSHPFGSPEENYGNLDPIYRDNPNNPGELILDLDAMIKNYDLDQEVQENTLAIYPKFDNGVTEIINPEHESLKYRDTISVIEDTYLSKNVQQWTNAWTFELEAEYGKYGDNFYTDLGRLLMKNEMQYQMNNLGIVNTQDDFEVFSGMALTSLPPHIGYSSIIHATDGHYYWLQGGTHANKVNYYKTTQLQYPNFPEEIDAIPSETPPRISIQMKGHNDLKSAPPFTVLSQPGEVEFYNETPGRLTVFINKDGVSEYGSEQTQEIWARNNSGTTWPLLESGSYSWHGEVPTTIDNKEYELNTGGGILVLSDDMSNLSREEQMETAKMMLITSGLPIVGMGQRDTDDTLYISLDSAIHELLPESKQYYLQRAQQLIPFDITIKLDR